jgi:hypothetical protein
MGCRDFLKLVIDCFFEGSPVELDIAPRMSFYSLAFCPGFDVRFMDSKFSFLFSFVDQRACEGP